jgi:hypothetical protein
MHDEKQIPIWFFIGGLLLVYGVLICGAGIYAMIFPPPMEHRVALFELHADIWWGVFLAILGVIYSLRYNPWHKQD